MALRSTVTVLMVGHLEYTLSPFEDVAALTGALLQAATAGAGLVNFRANGDVEVFVLIMPGVTVVLEERELTTSRDADEERAETEPEEITDFDMF